MKKIVMLLVMCSLWCSMFAQSRLPFVSHTPVQADPIQITPPRINRGSYYDPLGLGSMSSRTQRVSVHQIHYGLTLGAAYNPNDVAWKCLERYGERADFGESGNFYQIRIYSECTQEGAVFGGFTIDFYKGRFWKIIYQDVKNDPREFADRLENKLINYSVSDTRYEYQCGDTYIEFDGEDLFYVSESVTKSILDANKY